MPFIPKNLHTKYGLNTTVPIIPSLPQQSPANTKINVTSTSSEPTSITPPLQVVQAESKTDDAAKSKMDLIRLKTKELLTYHCGCHGNLVTITMR